MNAVHLAGRVGRKPELRSTPNGSPVAFFSLATDSYVRSKGEEAIKRTTWLPCVIFGPAAVNLVTVLRQGSQVSIDGTLTTHSVEDADLNRRIEIKVKVLQWDLLSHPRPKATAEAGSETPAEAGEAGKVEESGSPDAEVEGDDIPF